MYNWPSVDMDGMRRWRTERVVALMREYRLDHLILTGFDNIRYATDYRTQIIAEAYDWFAAVINADGAARIFVPWVDEDTEVSDPTLPNVVAVHPLPSWTPAVPHANYWAEVIAPHLRGAHRVGYELLYPEIIAGLGGYLDAVDFVPVATELFDLRQVKHPTELILLEAASIVNASAAQAALTAARPGMTDLDVLAVVMGDLQRQGVEFLSHSLCNHRRGSGTWFAAGTVRGESDPYFFDIGYYGLGATPRTSLAPASSVSRSRRSGTPTACCWTPTRSGRRPPVPASRCPTCTSRGTAISKRRAIRARPTRWGTGSGCAPASCRPSTARIGWVATRS